MPVTTETQLPAESPAPMEDPHESPFGFAILFPNKHKTAASGRIEEQTRLKHASADADDHGTTDQTGDDDGSAPRGDS